MTDHPAWTVDLLVEALIQHQKRTRGPCAHSLRQLSSLTGWAAPTPVALVLSGTLGCSALSTTATVPTGGAPLL